MRRRGLIQLLFSVTGVIPCRRVGIFTRWKKNHADNAIAVHFKPATVTVKLFWWKDHFTTRTVHACITEILTIFSRFFEKVLSELFELQRSSLAGVRVVHTIMSALSCRRISIALAFNMHVKSKHFLPINKCCMNISYIK